MNVPAALTASPLNAEVESPMHAFTANQVGEIEFWAVWARGVSTQPAFCKYSCTNPPSGDGLTDVENYYNYCQSRTWSIADGSGGTYQQTDTLDPDTFEPLTASIDINTFSPPGFYGSPAIWNDLTGYEVSGAVTCSGGDWDKSTTRAGILAALDGVNWTNLWAGSTTENSDFRYNRVQIGFNEQGPLPFTGGTYPFGPPATGAIVASPGGFGPKKILTGKVGQVIVPLTAADGSSNSDGLGVNLVRSQIQIRNFSGKPIPYIIVEQAPAVDGVTHTTNLQRVPTSLTLNNFDIYFRKIGEGQWDHDRQIVQLPDAAMDGPQRITTAAGVKVRNGTAVFMVVGMTFEDYMAAIRGPSWADYIFT